jgi:hypothetical protein
MSRPFRHLLSGVSLIAALALSGCVGTIYDRTYSYQKNYFKPPKDKATVSAESILGPTGHSDTATLDNPVPGGLPEPGAPAAPAPGMAAPDAIPGLPPATPPTPPGTPPPPPN